MCPDLGLSPNHSGATYPMSFYLGIVLALACAVITQLGFLYKHRGACEAPQVDIAHPLRSAKSLFSNKWFAIGWGVAVGAWVLHVLAMAVAPLSVVQAVLSTGVVMLAVLAERVFGFKVGRRQWVGVGLTALGLVLLVVVTLPSAPGAHSSFSTARDDRLRGRHARPRRAADLGQAPRRA